MRRIKAQNVEQFLLDAGHLLSEFEDGEWDPGVRVTQSGPRLALVFWDGPGEADQLQHLAAELRQQGYHVHATQQDRGGRRRLEVTLP